MAKKVTKLTGHQYYIPKVLPGNMRDRGRNTVSLDS